MIEAVDLRPLLNMSKPILWDKLAEVCTDLANLQQEIGIAEADQIRGRAAAFQRSDQASANGRNQEADVATMTLASTLVELYADKGTLLEQKFFIVRLLDA